MAKKGKLVVAGTGIRFLNEMTLETINHCKDADIVFFLSNDPLLQHWLDDEQIPSLNLHEIYYSVPKRIDAYSAIALHIKKELENGLNICFLSYGHPAICSKPGLLAMSLAQNSAIKTKMLPAISAEDRLFADLLIDPCSCGTLSYEATDFLVHDKPIVTSCNIILWQIAVTGIIEHAKATDHPHVSILQNKLLEYYPNDFKVIIYQASHIPLEDPIIINTTVDQLVHNDIPRFATLYIPALTSPKANQDILDKLNLSS